jgi:hypothetical protein
MKRSIVYNVLVSSSNPKASGFKITNPGPKESICLECNLPSNKCRGNKNCKRYQEGLLKLEDAAK